MKTLIKINTFINEKKRKYLKKNYYLCTYKNITRDQIQNGGRLYFLQNINKNFSHVKFNYDLEGK